MREVENSLIYQERKLLDVKMWLWYRIGVEGDPKVRDKLFKAFYLISLAVLTLEVVNYLTNEEYNDSNSARFKSTDKPQSNSGFTRNTD